MVTGARTMVAIEQAKKIIIESKDKQEAVNKLLNLPKRQPAPQAPEGGISINAAARKFRVNDVTVGRWVKRKLIPVLLTTKNTIYIDEQATKRLVIKYKSAPGRGKRTIFIDNL